MDKSRIMYNMTVKDVREGLKEMRTIVVPVGIVEQQGYHLPLSTDIHNAVEIASSTSAVTGCFVAPPVHYSFSGGTLPGTINISPQTFSLVLMDICRSLVMQGFKNIIFLLGHGGTESTHSAREAAVMFQRLHSGLEDVCIAVVPFGELSQTYMKSITEGDFHAGRYETSLMLHWKPELVRMEEAATDDEALVDRLRKDPDSYACAETVIEDDFVIPRFIQDPNIKVGVMGDWSGASAEFGKIIAEECAESLAALVNKLEGRLDYD